LEVDELASLIPRPLPEDPVIRAYAEQVLKQGYVVIPDCFTKAQVRDAVAEIDRLSTKDGIKPWTGRNAFEGSQTNRIFAILNKTRKVDHFFIQPQILALNDYFLEADYLLYVVAKQTAIT